MVNEAATGEGDPEGGPTLSASPVPTRLLIGNFTPFALAILHVAMGCISVEVDAGANVAV